MKPILRIKDLCKQYRIGASQANYVTMREALANKVKASFGQPVVNNRVGFETIWALKDVSFEVYPGEVVGIIGRNGAGKSTLLKIISRIVEPTAGRVELYGRVGSLLEVGTGFHPELTGRENVFLNGAILGMARTEIERKFDEIVAFSEIEQFIDTPVKFYSSGMYLRLAFSVAAHLDPEILIMDEVLAVGDSAFQHKCLDKMSEVRQKGRTILFVSHSMSAVTRLCERAVLLDKGRVLTQGYVPQVVAAYLHKDKQTRAEKRWDNLAESPGDNIVRLQSVRVCTETGLKTDTIDIRHPVGIEIAYKIFEDGFTLVPNFHFYDDEGRQVFAAIDPAEEWPRPTKPAGEYVTTAWIPGNLLSEGSLTVGIAISSYYPMIVHLFETNTVAFQVIDNLELDSARGDYKGPMPGVIRPQLNWVTRYKSVDRSDVAR